MGMPLAGEDSDIALIDGAFKLLTSRDGNVADLAWQELQGIVEARTGQPPELQALSQFLSGDEIRSADNRISSIWTKARCASRRLKVRWELNGDRSVLIECGDVVVTDRRKVFKTLRGCLRHGRCEAIQELPHQGKTFPSYSISPASTHFLRAGDFTRFADWRFVHRARLGLVPLNGYRPGAGSDERCCRRCPFPKETLPHVLCHCHLPRATERHNAVVNRVKKAALKKWQIMAENQYVGQTRLKPDLVLTKGEEALIIDVTVPFENGPDAFQSARLSKEGKYAALAENLRGRYSRVSVEAVVVGALGSWDRANDRVIRKLCSGKYAKLMRKLIVSDVIRQSRDIYIEHLTGFRPSPPSGQSQQNIRARVANMRREVAVNHPPSDNIQTETSHSMS